METTIYLIRHAQMHPSPSIHYSEWPLSTVGQGQAEKLCGLLEPLGIEVMFSSPFLRCLQTVQSFADKAVIDINVKDNLRERLVVQGMISLTSGAGPGMTSISRCRDAKAPWMPKNGSPQLSKTYLLGINAKRLASAPMGMS